MNPRGIVLIAGAAVMVGLVRPASSPASGSSSSPGSPTSRPPQPPAAPARCGVPASCSPPSDSPSACGCRNGRPVDSYELLALAALALGGSVVLVALLDARRGWQLSGMSIALPALLFGAFAVLDQKGVRPFAGPVYGYAALLAPWGLVELRR